MEQNGTVEFAPKFLVGLDIQTHGSGGENLGCDEAETIGLGLVVVDAKTAQVIRAHSVYVQPGETSKINWDNVKEKGFDQARVLTAQHLDGALQEVENFLKAQGVGSKSFVFVTDGQLPIRQVIFPEALKKNITLPTYYNIFGDIRKEYRRLLNNNESLGTLQDIVNYIGLEQPAGEGSEFKNRSFLGGAISRLLKECSQKGLECFRELETVKTHLEHGICEKGDLIDGNTVVRARGLPWQSSDTDVAKFFVGLNIAKGGVALCLSNQGRRNGEALVRFENPEHRDMALRRHRHFMGNRYIEIYRATGDDFINVAAGNNTEAQAFLTRGADVIVRMRGLPYEATAEQILEFFRSGDHSVEVMDGEDGILFVNKVDGRATGDAFVLFQTEDDAAIALGKHKEVIGTRYIELFRSTTAEVQQVINKSMEPPKPEVTPSVTPGLIGAMPNVPGLANLTNAAAMLQPHQLVISGQKKDCIRLRGLPYEAQVQHILDFLGEYAKHIVFQGVHMVYNAQGHPSGEAFIQMDGEAAAVATASERHNKYMQIGKKQRYIEVFQCSADDMNLVLTGPAASSAAGLPVASNILPNVAAAAITQRPLISPGGTLLPGFAGTGGLVSPTAAMTAPNHFSQPLINAQLLGAGAGMGMGVGMGTGLQNGYAAAIPGLLGGAGGARVPVIPGLTGVVPVSSPGAVVYWPYPSPPVSPSNYYAAVQNQAALAAAQNQAAVAAAPAVVLMRSLPFNTTTADILAFFQGYAELGAESVQIQRTANGQTTGDALVTFPSRLEAERAILEKNRQLIGQRPVELFICSI